MSLRFPDQGGRGRRHPEPTHPYRTPFQRDRDRIIHSRAFRRLENKTQVFTNPLSDHFRNRLTHSIEVGQIARTVAAALDLNLDLTEALALAHDLGHPPFGHAGEKTLDEQMRRFGDRFDHNLQALRVVETFEVRYASFPGLNLTFEVREGLVKHSRTPKAADHPELAEYELDLQPTLEAQLIDPADEIAYNTADLDDAVEARALDVGEVRERVEAFDQAWRAAESAHPQAKRWVMFNEALRGFIDFLVGGLIEGSRQAVAEACVSSANEVRLQQRRLASFTPPAAEASAELKKVLGEKVYRSAAMEVASMKAHEKISALFQRWLDHPDEMPQTYRDRARDEPLHRIVCDYIAGMTDLFLLRRYEALSRD